MNLPHYENLICNHIIENQNHYIEFHFGIPNQIMIDFIEYLYSGAYTLVVVDVVTYATVHALRLDVNRGQNKNGKVVVLPLFQS